MRIGRETHIQRQGTDDTPVLLSLPHASARDAKWLADRGYGPLFVDSDPPGRQLGSGGGTAALLDSAWRAENRPHGDLMEWVSSRRRILVHGSGESRRLPAYSATGKPLIPLPPLPVGVPRRPMTILFDLQMEAAERILRSAPESYRLQLVCGDVFIHFERWLPSFPEADVLIAGLPASPEEAQHHGVMVCEKGRPDRLVRFLQKPSAPQVQEMSRTHECWLDTGTWLFSARALEALLHSCGWNAGSRTFPVGGPRHYDLYGTFGLALGTMPTTNLPEFNGLTSAVLPMPDGRFYHFGTSRSMVRSTLTLGSPPSRRRSIGDSDAAPSVVVLHSKVAADLSAVHDTWIENSVIPSGWRLSRQHILTGIPPNDSALEFDAGICLDVAPLVDESIVIHPYGFEDPMRGSACEQTTLFLGWPMPEWMAARDVTPADIGIDSATDIFDAPLFPVLPPTPFPDEMVRWMIARRPGNGAVRGRWLACRRHSARDLLAACDLHRAAKVRDERLREQWTLSDADWAETPPRIDYGTAADSGVRTEPAPASIPATLAGAHRAMFESAVAARRGESTGAAAREADAFRALRESIVHEMEVSPVRPKRNVLEDQIVWARSPVRLDLAGGWTDTPPYCIEYGGRVVNIAVDLNGQPPIQVFGRLTREPRIVVRSIDLGLEETIETFESLCAFGQLGSGFGIARAALALAGFDPRFLAGTPHRTLREQLGGEVGGGIDLSMLAAVPKGSGLGTSSILAATVLGALSELLGLGWAQHDIIARTLALEQILGAGGGWQDQVGGVTRGLKLVETVPGLVQNPVLRGLPDGLLGGADANRTVLLYYTGLTRVAHGILNEIVRGMFLNSASHIGIIREIGENAAFAADVLQRGDRDGLCEAVRRSWALNRRLDAGTNPPAVQQIVQRIGDRVAAVKLLGAGGGGYLLIMARDAQAGESIRRDLKGNPPNAAARFVDFGVSGTGLQVTKS